MSRYLPNFNNMYANLSQSAYPKNPKNFPKHSDSGAFQQVDYSQDHSHTYGKKNDKTHLTQGGQDLPNNGVVYLQPDLTLKDTYRPGRPTYMKGDLTDEDIGFNAYFVTDTPVLDQNTKQTYLAIRGTDGMKISSTNDWMNNLHFGLFNGQTKQGKLATHAMKVKIADLNQHAPQAVLNLTGHSLGSIATVQGIAGLTPDELKKIGEVVLFNGPDTRASLEAMGLTEKEIEEIGKKITYYLNPFDLVSMLNRDHPNQVGMVHIAVPLQFTGSFDPISSHDMSRFQIGADGQILVASKDYHPYLIEAGEKLAKLLADKTNIINFNDKYRAIINEAKAKALKWSRQAVKDYPARINGASGSKKILLRAEFLHTASQLAILEIEEKARVLNNEMEERKETIRQKIEQTKFEIRNTIQYMSYHELEYMLDEFQLTDIWDVSIEEQTLDKADKFLKNVEHFSETLSHCAAVLKEVDEQGTALFNQILTGV